MNRPIILGLIFLHDRLFVLAAFWSASSTVLVLLVIVRLLIVGLHLHEVPFARVPVLPVVRVTKLAILTFPTMCLWKIVIFINLVDDEMVLLARDKVPILILQTANLQLLEDVISIDNYFLLHFKDEICVCCCDLFYYFALSAARG